MNDLALSLTKINRSVQLRYFTLCCLFIFAIFPDTSWSQEKKEIVYRASASDLEVLNQYSLPQFSFDSVFSSQFFDDVINVLQRDGYLLAGVDSVRAKNKSIIAYMSVGAKFTWATLKPGNIDEAILNSIGFKERFYKNKPFKYEEVTKLLDRIIEYSENNGFPFASVKFDSISIEDRHVKASINYQSGPFITFDTVELEGNSKTKALFLSNYLRIKPGFPYEEKKVGQATARLKRLPYIKISEAPYVSFQLKQGTPHIHLTDVKANQVDGIIGLLPNEGNGGKPLITGQFDLLLQNMFGSGKAVSLNWQRTQINSQNLDVRYSHPNLLKSPINVEAGFSLLKEDTLFINRNLSLSLSMLAGKHSNISVFTDIKVARTIADTGLEIPSVGESRYADFNLNQYGIGYDYSNINNPLIPTKGLNFDIKAAVGNKKFPEGKGSPMDSLNLSYVQYNLEARADYYFPVSKRFVIKSRFLAGSIISDQLFYNDLYRIGGLKTIRGFVENEFFVSDFAIGTVEGQYYLDNESYMFLFYDQGYIYTNINQKIEEFPAGLGAGLTFTTNAGAFSFVYALGRTSVQAFNVNFSKIHFGYITRF